MTVMAVLMLGITLISGLALGPKTFLLRQQVNAKQTSVIQSALLVFVARNNRLPCPADSTAGTGLELANCAS